MISGFLVIVCLLVATCLSMAIYFYHRKKDQAFASSSKQLKHELATSINYNDDIGCDLAIVDESGLKIIESREIPNIPASGYKIGVSDSALHRVRHLASDLFKSTTGIQNKTVEVIFKQEIQSGLAEGTYSLMRTKSGEVLADAVDSSGAVVGKARLIQNGKARQLASGAFQLVSIAVAQSHLADIERSLSAINESISEVISGQQNEDNSNITGACSYLQDIANSMKELRSPEDISQQKRNSIERTISDSYAWRDKLFEDLRSLNRTILSLDDLDMVGTGLTYNRLMELTARVAPLLKRRENFLQLASAISFVTAYLDPTQREFSKIDPCSDNWHTCMEDFRAAVMDRASKKISKSVLNFEGTLKLRINNIDSASSSYHKKSMEQQNNYISLQEKLMFSMGSLIDDDGGVHVAISFDEHGAVKEAAIL